MEAHVSRTVSCTHRCLSVRIGYTPSTWKDPPPSEEVEMSSRVAKTVPVVELISEAGRATPLAYADKWWRNPTMKDERN